MRKKGIWIAAILLIAAAVAAALIFLPGQEVKFSGDRVKSADPARFYLRFDRMNKDDAETLSLREGDALRVSWSIESGSVSLTVSMAGEEPIYQANDRGKGDEAAFELTVPKTGDYKISISARNAKGWMEFAGAEKE